MRTLNDITPPSRRKEMEPLSKHVLRVSERPPRFPYTTFIVAAAVIIVSIGALFYFSSSRVEVTPNTVSAAVQSSFTADQSGGALTYEVITAQKVATQSVQGSGTKAVNSSASGTITIYNTQTKSQKLITNTRFATAAGLIFRIHAPVTIPGGSAAHPGSVAVKVYADQPGDTYNIAPTSFTIPGFAGTALESEVYARSTSAMAGGASGTIPVVDPAVATQTQGALISALSPDLLASIQKQVPPGYILLTGAATTTFQELTPVPSGTTGQVDVKEQGTITAVVFPNAALAGAIAASVPALGYQNEPLTLASSSNLALSGFTLPDPSATSFSFVLSGTASLVYTVDPTRIAAAVAGKSRSAAEVAL
ncbi:MAG: hypothetical protein B7X03_02205, partial [Parcubacteria group bacterium 21-58-10]